MSALPVDSGSLRHRIDIEKRTDDTRDSFNNIIKGYEKVRSAWSRVTPITGMERIEADRVEGGLTHRVVMRYVSGITPKMRIIHRGRILEIRSVVDIEEMRRQLVILCTEDVKAD